MGVKISELTEASSVQNVDLLALVQNGETKKVAMDTILDFIQNQQPIKHAIQASLHTNFTIVQNKTYLKLDGLQEDCLIGDKVTINNDSEIVIGADVNHVRIYASMCYVTSTADNRHLRVIKNNNSDNLLIWRYQRIEGMGNLGGETIVPVQQGDTICLYYYGLTNDVIAGNSYGGRTSLIVEVID